MTSKRKGWFRSLSTYWVGWADTVDDVRKACIQKRKEALQRGILVVWRVREAKVTVFGESFTVPVGVVKITADNKVSR